MAAEAPRRLRLLGRSWCHLCEEMATALAPLLEESGWTVGIEDVDADPALEARYGELVPVLLHGDRELCHYRLDAAAVRAYLGALR